jgi:hypothetical protein
VKTQGSFRRPPWPELDITFCDINFGKSVLVAAYRLIESGCGDLIQRGEIAIEHDLLVANQIDFRSDALDGDDIHRPVHDAMIAGPRQAAKKNGPHGPFFLWKR